MPFGVVAPWPAAAWPGEGPPEACAPGLVGPLGEGERLIETPDPLTPASAPRPAIDGVETEMLGADFDVPVLLGVLPVTFTGVLGTFTGALGSEVFLTGTVGTFTGTVGVFTGTVGAFTGTVGVFTGTVGTLTGTVGVLTVGVFTGTVGVVTVTVGVLTGSFGASAGTVGVSTGRLNEKAGEALSASTRMVATGTRHAGRRRGVFEVSEDFVVRAIRNS